MPRINYDGQSYELPSRVNGVDIRQALDVQPNEVPVRVGRDGSYEPISNNDEYHIEDSTQFDKVHRLENGAKRRV